LEGAVTAISALISNLQSTAACHVEARRGRPLLGSGHVLPSDLAEFYDRCGGATLFVSAPYSATILPPERLVLANPVIVGRQFEEDISASWYLIMEDANGNYVSIDLHPKRLGRCYESFFDTHGVAGSCPTVARTFESLLAQLLAGKGERWFWMQPGFEPLSDAYD
jgi:hypothetical protein